jgi:hypothetical protein
MVTLLVVIAVLFLLGFWFCPNYLRDDVDGEEIAEDVSTKVAD